LQAEADEARARLPARPKEIDMNELRGVVIAVALAVSALLIAGCEKGPMQKAGEKVDRAIDTDKVIGKGPVEKAGKKVDKAVDDVKR
jgi:hypothetical protein